MNDHSKVTRRLSRAKWICLLVMLLTVATPYLQNSAAAAPIPETEFGDVLDARSVELVPGVEYNWYDMKVDRGLEKIHFVEFDPKNEHLELQAGTSNGHVMGFRSLTNMAKDVDAPGNRVIAGVNGDFYTVSNGIPLGLFITDGKILNTPSSSTHYAFGLTSDGTSVYGQPPTLTKTVTIEGATHGITHINRLRDNNQLVLFTPEFNTSTQSDSNGDEVVLEVLSGEVKSGETMQLKVTAVHNGKGNTPIPNGHIVLSASGTARAALAGLEVNDEITAQFQFNSPWNDVVVAIGGNTMVLRDGVVQTGDTAVHPRSAIGTKADGSIVLFEIDGRQPGFSEGVTTGEVGQILKDMGVVNAMNLDGGGSATLAARMPGDSAVRMVNSGSDGGERNNANGLLLVSKAPETGMAAKLAVTPNFDRVLVNSKLAYQAKAVDVNGHPAPLGEEVAWSAANSAIGSFAEHVFQASDTAGTTTIAVNGDTLTGSATVEVVDSLTELKFPTEERSVNPGQTITIPATALLDGKVIKADADQLNWSLEGPIGTINEQGIFVAASTNNVSGKIIVSYGDISTEMRVNVGLAPVVVEDFESYANNTAFYQKYLQTAGALYNTARVSLETNPDYVRSGTNSLKLEYDFTGKTGTSGAYLKANSVSNNIPVSGYPTKISMWVYGDNSGDWLRAQFRDGSSATGAVMGIDLTPATTGVNWTGWKYVEANILTGRPLDLKIDEPVRIMQTNNTKKRSGTIYVDDIRLIYGNVTEDRTAPIIKNMSPAPDAIINNNLPTILAYGEDAGYDPVQNPANTLIDQEKIRFYLNGELVEHHLYVTNGQISYLPSESLDDGIHHVKLAVRDYEGNETIREWSFIVDTGSSQFKYATPAELLVGHTYTVDIKGQAIEQMKGGHLELKFDPTATANWSVTPGAKLTEAHAAGTANSGTGAVRVTFDDLDALELTDEDVLAQISYQVKADASGNRSKIDFVSGGIVQAGTETTKGFVGPALQFQFDHELALAWDEGYAHGQQTTFTVTDKNDQPVAGAHITSGGVPVGGGALVTNEQGQLQTRELTATVQTLMLQAVKGEQHSKPVEFTVSPFAGSVTPYNVNVAFGADTTSERRFNWNTNPSVQTTVVQVAKKSEFTNFDAANVTTFTGTNHSYNTTSHGTIQVHKAAASGLEAGTEYVYRVGDGAANFGDEGTFTTAAGGNADTKFFVFGDSQAGSLAGFEKWGHTFDVAATEHPDADFAIHLGDIVDHGHNEQQWNWWFETAQERLMNTTIATVVGNHEVTGTKKNQDYLAHFNNPNSSYDSEDMQGTVYSFDYNDIHFVMLNTEYEVEQQKEWLRADLAQNDKKWTVVVFHRSPYGSTYMTENVRTHWVPVLDEFGVDLVLNGHDHIYLRTHAMKNGEPVADGQGTTYLIPSATGDKFYGLNPYPWQKVTDTEQTQMYATVEASGNELNVVTKTVAGRTVDSFTLMKDESPAPQPESVELNLEAAELEIGETVQLAATVKPDEVEDQAINWTISDSSEEGVVSVSTTGLVTALKEGTATVRAASSIAAGVFAEAIITVTRPDVTPDPEISALLTGVGEVAEGASFELVYGLNGINGPVAGQDVVVTFDEEKVRFVGFGEPSEKEGWILLADDQDVTGTVRFIAFDISEDADASNTQLARLQFEALRVDESASTTISIASVKIGNLEGMETSAAGADHSVMITALDEVDKTELLELVAGANSIHTAATEGAAAGQYPIGSKAVLKAAIDAAQLVAINGDATEAEVSDAIEDLSTALAAFRSSVNVAQPGDVNEDGQFTVGDMSSIVGAYGLNDKHPEWATKYAAFDYNDDGEIGLEDLVYVARRILGKA
ncbi:phosphodiester glycosidase family protein [Paenibacillus sp. PAMC21692]|uniref:phosphodiester glycosidase family protein n=1 Tax=Paenibacillus sp. PAMC21692 TaxID=2762320 RepID=UPI00164D6BFD|nr:phosphodiester glycosidase family protein [Paenibacillus sp. PAMC21692]QNK56749.1 phosphodiester glycosidase family protein [Paenibacillus sp. PAMC21692]